MHFLQLSPFAPTSSVPARYLFYIATAILIFEVSFVSGWQIHGLEYTNWCWWRESSAKKVTSPFTGRQLRGASQEGKNVAFPGHVLVAPNRRVETELELTSPWPRWVRSRQKAYRRGNLFCRHYIWTWLGLLLHITFHAFLYDENSSNLRHWDGAPHF